MDYQGRINQFVLETKSQIISSLEKHKQEKRGYFKAIDKVRIDLYKQQGINPICINQTIFQNIVYIFNHHEDYYEVGTPIDFVINNEIKEEFTNIQSREIFDKDYKILVDYSFERMMIDLIEYDYLGRIAGRLLIERNAKINNQCYESQNYEKFTLELIPEKTQPQKNTSTGIDEIEFHKREFLKTQEHFNDNDKAFIIHLCLNKNVIPITEKVKLILIARNIEEYKIFTEPANKNTFYSQVIKGIDYKASEKTKIEFLDEFLTKLKPFKLDKTIEYLMSLKLKTKNS